MTKHIEPSDLEFAALISSKICHDVIGPVGAIYNGLEMVAEDTGAASRANALEVVRNVTEQASARLQFARFAFGAAGSASAEIELDQARQIAAGLVGNGKKHQIVWHATSGTLPKAKTKLLLNLLACAMTSIPRGGEIRVDVARLDQTATFTLTCSGRTARPPLYLTDFITDANSIEIDALSIQAYYTLRLARATNMNLSIEQHGDEICLIAAS